MKTFTSNEHIGLIRIIVKTVLGTDGEKRRLKTRFRQLRRKRGYFFIRRTIVFSKKLLQSLLVIIHSVKYFAKKKKKINVIILEQNRDGLKLIICRQSFENWQFFRVFSKLKRR